MKTNMDCRSLGERGSNYTNSNVRQMKQKETTTSSIGKTKSKGGSGAVAAGLLAGASVGVLAGILMAPKKGKDLRKQVTDSASKLGTQATSLYNTSRDKVTSWTSKGSTGNTASNTSGTNTDTKREVNNDPATSITM